VADAVSIEPVSSRQIPVYQGKNREFCRVEGVVSYLPANKCPMSQRVSAKFPVRSEPGILLSNREIFRCETGNRRAEEGIQLKRLGSQNLYRPIYTREGCAKGNGNTASRITDKIQP
jgi:hypothetical protein